jgi:hypothetical protein
VIEQTGTTLRKGRSFGERRVLDALVLDGHDALGLLAHEVDDLVDLLDLEADPSPLCVCRRITEDGVVVLGNAHPDRDPLLSFVVGGNDGGTD